LPNPKRPLPPSVLDDLSKLIRQLQSDLNAALNMFVTQSKLKGQLETLWAMSRFLDDLGIDSQTRAPLLSVISDLTDSRRDGAEKPLAELANMVLAAATLDTLMNAGMTMQPAARSVVKATGLSITVEQLITYRKSLTRRTSSRSRATRLYDEICQQSAKEWGHLDRSDRIEEALAGLSGAIVHPAQKV
jgi:hypothetical protein